MKATVRLPPLTVARLRALPRAEQRSELARLHALGWSLTALGVAVDAHATTVTCWIKSAALADAPRSQPRPPHAAMNPSVNPELIPARIASRAATLSPAEAESLRVLSDRAARVRGGTSRRAVSWQARAELDTQLRRHRDRGVPIAHLAAAMGRTTRAVRDRVAEFDEPTRSTLRAAGTAGTAGTAEPRVAVWPGVGASLRWSTFVLASDPQRVLNVSPWLYCLPVTAQLLTADEAREQLGWTVFHTQEVSESV